VDATIVTFPMKIADDTESEGSIKGSIKGGTKGGAKILTTKQKELLELIKDNNTISIEIVSTKLNINRSATQKRFETLKNKGIIERISGKSGGYWKILIDL
jgi:predicted HTH transcriptional regulator